MAKNQNLIDWWSCADAWFWKGASWPQTGQDAPAGYTHVVVEFNRAITESEESLLLFSSGNNDNYDTVNKETLIAGKRYLYNICDLDFWEGADNISLGIRSRTGGLSNISSVVSKISLQNLGDKYFINPIDVSLFKSEDSWKNWVSWAAANVQFGNPYSDNNWFDYDYLVVELKRETTNEGIALRVQDGDPGVMFGLRNGTKFYVETKDIALKDGEIPYAEIEKMGLAVVVDPYAGNYGDVPANFFDDVFDYLYFTNTKPDNTYIEFDK